MKTLLAIFIFILSFSYSTKAQDTARSIIPWEVHALKVKSDAMLSTGSILLAGSIGLITYGSIEINRVEKRNLTTAPTFYSRLNTGQAIAITTAGLLTTVAGTMLLTFGAKARKDYNLGKKQLSLGILPNGNVGLSVSL